MILVRHGQSHFNAIYNETGEDPGIVDPGLTEAGIQQAEEAAEVLAGRGLTSILASPFQRTLETAEILTAHLDLPVVVDALVREQAAFACDIGSPRETLTVRWPKFDFNAVTDRWWSQSGESEAQVQARCRIFQDQMLARGDWQSLLVVTHYGFIKGLTGATVANCEHRSFDPR